MTHGDIIDAFNDRVAAGEKAEREKEFRQAAGIFQDVSGAYSELATRNPDAPDLFFAGMAHYYGAKTFRALYSASEQERGAASELYEEASQVVKFSRNGVQTFRKFGDLNGVELCYGLLIDGLLQCLMTRRDTAGIVSAENDLLNAIGEYRTICPAGKNKEYLIKLLFIQASIAQKEGTRLVLQEYNALASQAFFKKSRGYLDAVRNLTEGMDGILRQIDDNERQGRGMSLFGEGFILQERGEHVESAERFQKAEEELGRLTSPADLAFARWAKAAQHANAAMQSELNGNYEACVKEYRAASAAYAIAADRFPNDQDAYYTNAARMRFYAEASTARANAALARGNDIEVQLHKGRKSAGLIFFALWVVSGAGIVAALKFLSQSIAGFEFITVLVITFVGSMLAAALIKPTEAMHILQNVGLGHRTKGAAPKQNGA